MLVSISVVLLAFVGPGSAEDQPFETKAQQALLMEAGTGTILYQKNADTRFEPASMAKLMTMAVVFDALATGRLSLDDEFQVSEHAWRTGGAVSHGATMFAELGSSIKVSDLIRGVIVQAANDGCIILAEGMAGSEESFAELMNAEAKKLGMEDSNFVNPTGYADPQQYVTARDLAKLAKHLIDDFPQYYPIYSEEAFTWNKIFQRNRNPLLSMNIGADGLTTGATEDGGFGLAGSAVRDGQRLILVLGGTQSEKERAAEARRLLDWGLHAFERVTLFARGEQIAEANVFGGTQSHVWVVSNADVDVLLPIGERDQIKGRVVYEGPVPAPVAAGTEVGTLQITLDNQVLREATVYAEADIGVGNTQQRALDGLMELLLGWW